MKKKSKIGIHFAKLQQEDGCLLHFVRKSIIQLTARHDPSFARYNDKYLPISIFFTNRLSNKPVLIRLLTMLPHLKYQTTVPGKGGNVTSAGW